MSKRQLISPTQPANKRRKLNERSKLSRKRTTTDPLKSGLYVAISAVKEDESSLCNPCAKVTNHYNFMCVNSQKLHFNSYSMLNVKNTQKTPFIVNQEMKTSQTSSSSLWPPHSPSPSPPQILLLTQQIYDDDDDDDDGNNSLLNDIEIALIYKDDKDDDNLSDISGILDNNVLPHIKEQKTKTILNNNHNGHHDLQQNSNNDIDNKSDDDDDIEIEIEIIKKSKRHLSPSPPWGRSPSPPPSQYFHKPTKKKSRWDEKSEKTLKTNKTITNGMNNLINAGVNSLIHSINLQQQKQQKVEPLLLDEHGNPLTSYDDDEYDDYDEYDEHEDILDIDKLNGQTNDDMDTDEFYDENIMVKPPTRSGRHKAFKFIEQGTYQQKANKMRRKELHKSKHKPPRLDIDSLSKKLHDDEGLEWLDRVPNVEWWDAPLLTDKNDYSSPYKKEMVTDLIENPTILRPELLREGVSIGTNNNNPNDINNNNKSSNSATPWILTKEEKKKMKRMKKKEEHQRRTDEIRIGLREPPEPRITLSNLVRVLGVAAIRDPTAAENIARAQMWKRKAKHELHNATNQLNPQQKREKKRRKLQEDTSKEVHVTIFVIYNLFGKLNKSKICREATQRNLTGGLIMLNTNDGDNNHELKKEQDGELKDIKDGIKDSKSKPFIGGSGDGFCELSLNMVIAEGGPKGITKYQRLLQHRIKWNNKPENCEKMWEGTVAKRSFQKFHQMKMKTESDLKKFLKIHNSLSYWDIVKNHAMSRI